MLSGRYSTAMSETSVELRVANGPPWVVVRWPWGRKGRMRVVRGRMRVLRGGGEKEKGEEWEVGGKE